MITLAHSEASFEVGEEYHVFVTHINSPQSFYIRSVLFHNVMSNLEEPGERVKVIHPGMNVVYLSQMCNKYIRGYITAVGVNNARLAYTIFASDYGFTDFNVLRENITQPKYDFYIPPLAIHCELHNCTPRAQGGFSDEAISAMKYYVGGEVAQMTVQDKSYGKIVVELRNSCPDDVATMLAMTEFTGFSAAVNNVHRYANAAAAIPVYKFKFRKMKIGEVLHVRVLGGESMSAFYVAEVSEFKIFRPHEQRQFTDHCKTLEGATSVSVGECVGIMKHHPPTYERAIVKQIAGKRALVRLIDLGTEEVVTINLLKIIKGARYTAQPALALYCSANPNKVWYNNLSKFLYPGYEFQIKILQPGHEFEIPTQVDLIRI